MVTRDTKEANYSGTDYSGWNKKKLIGRLLKLENELGVSRSKVDEKLKIEEKDQFIPHLARHIALKVAYYDWDEPSRDGNDNIKKVKGNLPIVAYKLLNALWKGRLITKDQKACSLAMCGRTDKGVSALSQVFSVWVRTNAQEGTPGTIPWSELLKDPCYVQNEILKDGLYDTPNTEALHKKTLQTLSTHSDISNEIDYIGVINKYLPNNIYVWAWSPVSPGFSARYTCSRRKYAYLFPGNGLNLIKMQTACQYYVGMHDFVNYSKVDPRKNNVVTVRNVINCDIKYFNPSNFTPTKYTLDPIDSHLDELGFTLVDNQMFSFVVECHGFLWNQVRRMVYMVFMIGLGLLPLSIINETLSEKRSRNLPFIHSYNSPAYPLLFIDCVYPSFCNLSWVYPSNTPSPPPSSNSSSPRTSLSARHFIFKFDRFYFEQSIKAVQLKALESISSFISPRINRPSLYSKNLPKESFFLLLK